MSSDFGLVYPLNPQLKYKYPDPNPLILNNIINAIASVPKLYNQVLHLMNKMNLPAPFLKATPSPLSLFPPPQQPQNTVPPYSQRYPPQNTQHFHPPLDPQHFGPPQHAMGHSVHIPQMVPHPPQMVPHPNDIQPILACPPQIPLNPPMPADETSNESEIESDEQSNEQTEQKTKVTKKRKSALKGTDVKRCRLKINQDTPTTVKSVKMNVTDMFEPIVEEKKTFEMRTAERKAAELIAEIQRERIKQFPERTNDMPLHKDEMSLRKYDTEINIVKKQKVSKDTESSSGFGRIVPVEKVSEQILPDLEAEQEWDDSGFITSAQLRSGRLSSSKREQHKLYKNYKEGEKSSRLYIKNISKQTTEKDLHFLYGRYVDWSSESDRLTYDIRLMKQGHMKGQAFITLPNEEAAEYAVKETNGYELNGKVIVVQYGRSAKLKDTTKENKL